MKKHAVTILAILGVFIWVTCAAAEEKGEKISLDKAPAAVQAAIKKESADGVIKEVLLSKEDGKAFYCVIYTKKGKELDADFTADGKKVVETDKKDKK